MYPTKYDDTGEDFLIYLGNISTSARQNQARVREAVSADTTVTVELVTGDGTEISKGLLFLLYNTFSPAVFHAITGKNHWSE